METLKAEHVKDAFRRMTDHPIETGYLGPGIWIRIQHRFRNAHDRMDVGADHDVVGHRGPLVTHRPARLCRLPPNLRQRRISRLGNGDPRADRRRRPDVTPHIRMVSAAFGCLIFFGISYCYMLSGIVSTWFATTPSL